MKVLITRSFTRHTTPKVSVTKGEVLPEKKVLAKKVPTACYEFIRVGGTGELYTREEDVLLVRLYEQDDNLNHVADAFMATNQRHTRDSVYQLVSGLRTLDNRHPNDTRWVVKRHLQEVAEELNPERFA